VASDDENHHRLDLLRVIFACDFSVEGLGYAGPIWIAIEESVTVAIERSRSLSENLNPPLSPNRSASHYPKIQKRQIWI
jgi:hypothetical protein